MYQTIKKSWQIITAIITVIVFLILLPSRLDAATEDNRTFITISKSKCKTFREFTKDLREAESLGAYKVISFTYPYDYAIVYNKDYSDRYNAQVKIGSDTQKLVDNALNNGTLIQLGERWLLDRNKEIKNANLAAKSIETEYTTFYKSWNCAKPIGTTELMNVSGMDPYDPKISAALDVPGLESNFPLKGDPSTLLIIDTIVNADHIQIPHWDRVDKKGYSWIPNEFQDAIVSNMPYSPGTHGSTMTMLALSTNKNNAFNEAVSSTGLAIPTPRLYAAVMHALSLRKNNAVLSVSIGSRTWNDSMVTAAINGASQAGVPYVQSIGQPLDGSPGEHLRGPKDVFNPQQMTVGFTVNKEMKSNFGDAGPMLLVDLTGDSIDTTKNGDVKTIEARLHASSGATALVAGTISIARNVCPNSTPAEIYEAYCKTATKYTGLNENYVRCGFVNPVAAINKLKTYESCKPFDPYKRAPTGTQIRYETAISKQILSAPGGSKATPTAIADYYKELPYFTAACAAWGNDFVKIDNTYAAYYQARCIGKYYDNGAQTQGLVATKAYWRWWNSVTGQHGYTLTNPIK